MKLPKISPTKKYPLSIFLIICMLILFFLPIHIGDNANNNIPVLGHIEEFSQDYYTETLAKATAAYGVAKVINKTISTVQSTEINISPAGIGVSFAPGEMLAAANDGIERISSALFTIIGIMLVQKMVAGLVSFFCLKLMLPLAIVLILFHLYMPVIFPWGRRLGLVTIKLALVIWLFFPLSALVSGYVEESFINTEYSKTLDALDIDAMNIEFEATQQDVTQGIIPEISTDSEGWFGNISGAWESLWQSIVEFSPSNAIESLREKAYKIGNYADDMIDKLFLLFSMFVVTTILIPLAVLYIFMTLMRFLVAEAHGILQKTRPGKV